MQHRAKAEPLHAVYAAHLLALLRQNCLLVLLHHLLAGQHPWSGPRGSCSGAINSLRGRPRSHIPRVRVDAGRGARESSGGCGLVWEGAESRE